MNIPTFAIVLFLVLIEVNGIDRFDVSEKWPRCKDVFEDIQTQGNCSSSWAISVASSIRDRRCIKSGMKDQISAYDLISCCSDCQLDGKNGCNGGDHNSAFQFFINQGIVTGGEYHSYKGCKPYPISPDRKAYAPKSTQCFKSCESSYKTNSYENDKIKGGNLLKFSNNNQAVMDELMNNGSVVVEFQLFEDFLNYSGGIYQHKSGKLLGYYYAKILGWGVESETNTSFWRAAASFGSKWGENGTFRIQRGNDNVGFESNILAGTVTPADITCQKITSYYDGTFQWPEARGETFDAQIKVVVDVNLKNKRIYVKFDQWNTTLAKGYIFHIEERENWIRCDSAYDDPCYLPLVPIFWVEFQPYNAGFWPSLLWLHPLIDNRFTLLNAFGNCATSLKNNTFIDLDPNLFKSCFCCGDEYNPDPLLNCPVMPWS